MNNMMKKRAISAACMAGAAVVLMGVSVVVHADKGKETATQAESAKVSTDTKQSGKAKKEKVSKDDAIKGDAASAIENLAGVGVSLDQYTKGEKAPLKDEKDEISDEDKALQLNLVYDRLGIAKVDTYLNVRKHPSKTAKIVGKMTKNSGCNVYRIKKGWAEIVSGGVRGWVKASYLVTDKKAEKMALEVGTKMVEVKTETLNVRALPTTESKIYYLISEDSDYDVVKENLTEEFMNHFIEKNIKKKDLKEVGLSKVMSELDQWACIRVDDDKVFVSKKYVDFAYKLDRAVGIKEVKTTNEDGSSTGVSSIRASMVAYAMQFLGNRYVYGGTSLTNGTDCSGFTMRIYEHFGYGIPRVSGSQAAASRTINASEAKPGDLFFYGSGSVSHVAMYIGNGQVIHASTERTGIKISNAYYRSPIKVGRFIND